MTGGGVVQVPSRVLIWISQESSTDGVGLRRRSLARTVHSLLRGFTLLTYCIMVEHHQDRETQVDATPVSEEGFLA